jgi:hypothetical protein
VAPESLGNSGRTLEIINKKPGNSGRGCLEMNGRLASEVVAQSLEIVWRIV